jgi:hypothetical protein
MIGLVGKVAANVVDGSVPFLEKVVFSSTIYPSSIVFIYLMILATWFAQTISQALATAQEHLARSLLR